MTNNGSNIENAPEGILQITYAGRELGKSPLCSETHCKLNSLCLGCSLRRNT